VTACMQPDPRRALFAQTEGGPGKRGLRLARLDPVAAERLARYKSGAAAAPMRARLWSAVPHEPRGVSRLSRAEELNPPLVIACDGRCTPTCQCGASKSRSVARYVAAPRAPCAKRACVPCDAHTSDEVVEAERLDLACNRRPACPRVRCRLCVCAHVACVARVCVCCVCVRVQVRMQAHTCVSESASACAW
jgi:hypothetical protein